MTDLRDQLARLFDHEPAAPYDIERIVRSGRRARRRRTVAVAAAGTAGAAGLAAAVAVPLLATGGNQDSVSLGVRSAPSPSPTPSTPRCYVLAAPTKSAKRDVARLIRSGKVGTDPTVTTVKGGKRTHRAFLEVCAKGSSPVDPGQKQQAAPPAGPPYTYTEEPQAIASRLGAQLHDRVTGFGLSITYTRPFAQETSTLDDGRPSYYDGNVDVHDSTGYADIGVQVTHQVTAQVPFDGDCTAADHCTQTTLPDGSVVRTGEVKAGRGDLVLTAEVHRPDGVVVEAQESNYPFGPDAGSQPHGDQPLTLDQLVALAEDPSFTF
jgi:hypothetical protein